MTSAHHAVTVVQMQGYTNNGTAIRTSPHLYFYAKKSGRNDF